MKSAKIWAVAAVATSAMVLGYASLEALGKHPGSVQAAAVDAASPAKVDNFLLADADLDSHELYRLADAKAVVLITQMDGCPIVRNSNMDFKALQAAYAGKGVEFMMLNSSLQDKREEIQAEAKEYGFTMPVLMDVNQLVGDQLGVTRTAEVIVLNPKTWQIVYRGPVNDRVTYERQKAKADTNFAADALDSFLAGKPVQVASQQTAGCLIDFPDRAKQASFKTISYVKTIAPIVKEKCVGCHQPGGIGPMELTSYDKIKAFSPMIRETIRTNRMPPFHADPSVGKFHDDKSLSPDQIRSMIHWIEAGAPRGAGADPLGAVKFQAAEWPLGKPDVVLDVPAYTIPANGIVEYQRPWVANPLTEGKWLRASTVKVSARQGVHHILTGYMKDVPKGPTSNESMWGASVGGYAVGAESTISPKDVGTYVPAGGAIGFQNHYTPFGKEAVDKSQIALYFYKEPPKLMMRGATILDPSISIPAGEERHREVAYMTFPKDALLYSAFPHAHYRGNSSDVTIQYPDGSRKLLLALAKYDFNWQRAYEFAEPVKVPAGSKIIVSYTYDNSKRNPANPNPNRVVPWGDQSFDEMLFTALRFRWVDETAAKQTNYSELMAEGQVMGMLDDNIDGKLQLSELKGPIGAQLKVAFAALDADKDGAISQTELSAGQSVMNRRAAR